MGTRGQEPYQLRGLRTCFESLGLVDVDLDVDADADEFELSRFVGGIDWPEAREDCDATPPLALACDGRVTGLASLFSLVEGFGFARFRGIIMDYDVELEKSTP